MPTRTTDTQLFEGEYIKCAKMVIDEPCSWKAAQVVSFGTNYEFQMAIKASADTTITIQVGDSSETLDVTTEWQRYAISFPNVTIAESTSLYILFPIGTYWIYNMQLERAKTPSSWRPAPEDAEDYADQAAKQAVDDQTQLDIFNKLTNNGVVQGIYLLDGQLYINGEYIAANTLSADKIHGGTIDASDVTITNLNADNISSGTISADKIHGGTIDASDVTITNINASNIASGTMSANKISGGSIDANNVTITNLNASNITSGTISANKVSGGTLSGSQININNGTFKVDSSGNVTANSLSSSNAEITGGSINIVGSSSTQDKIVLSYSNFKTSISPGLIKVANTSAGQMLQLANGSVVLVSDTETSKNGFSVNSTGSLFLLNPGGTNRVMLNASSNTIELYDSSGTRRVRLNANGLYFYNSSGTLTKTYSAT